nr:LOW QUALITY PROTEIN: eukaryotic translation initiation factor 4 gamma 3 [Parasteatoda tepidariorum]
MSLNNKNNQKYSAFPNSQNRGHADFGQPSYPGQYAFTPQLSVSSNTPHDMNKQVAAGQPGMYTNSGGMPTAQQHHQSMAGPVPNPQPATLVQQGQQMRANPMAMPGYYTARSSVPRTIPNMGRTPLQTVVNQAGQQPTSHYGQIQMLPPFSHPMQPVIVNHQFQQMYQQRPFSPPQNIIFPAATGQPVYLNNQWGTPYHNPPQANSNGFYQSLPTYTNPIAPAQQITPQPAQQTQKKTKALAIIDPATGKNIFDGSTDEESSRPTPEKETENSDPNICVQFAAQVAATLNEKSEPLSKSSSVEDTRIIDSQTIISSNEIDAEPEDSELGDVESLADVESSSDIDNLEISRNVECIEKHSLPSLKDVDLNSINKTVYETDKSISQVIEPTLETQDSIYNCSKEKKSHEVSEELTSISSISNRADHSAADKSLHESPEIDNELISTVEPVVQKAVHETQVVPPSSINYDESKSVESDITEILSSSSNSKLTPEGKRGNKGKKKKTEYNKKGESKDGGEMDAFLDKGEEVVAVSVSTAPTVPQSQADEQPLSPLPAAIVDSELLSTIPLPGEILSDNSPQSDISLVEQQSDSSSVSPTIENEDKENVDDPAQNKTKQSNKLKYSYKEDQWSPVNIEGKKQYDRDFLLQLQCQPSSLVKPQNLPNLDVIKDKAHIQKLNEVNRQVQQQMPVMPNFRDHFLPTFAQRGVPRMPQMNNYTNRRSLQGRDSKTKKVISLSQNVKLHEADNAWKPLYKQDAGSDQIDLDKEKLKRSVQGILNKLTPQKFETLLTQVKNLNIDTEEKLCTIIDLIFEKAVDEPNFSVPYANMCKHLALIKVPTKNKDFVNFRKVLLTKCQKEFEQDRSDELKHEERVKALEEAAPEKKKELEQEMYDEEKKMRYRQLGNIRFIGELFKLGMLTEPIMHECIKRLISQGDEESLECLCKLLKTIGKELDDRKVKGSKESMMENYFNQMQKIVDKRLTSSRVRFMLQDVIDLKRNDWVPRRDENNPKTIDQIHKEAEREAREQQQNLQNMSFQKRVPDDRDRRKNTARNMGTSEDGWTSSTKSSKGSYSLVDPNKLKLTKPDEVDSIRLGPGRAMQSWGRGSSGGTKTPAGSFDPEKTALTNRYSALAEQTSNPSFIENRRGSQRSAASSRESSRGRNTQLPPAIRKTPSTSKERDNVIEAVKGLVRGGTSSETKATEIKKSPELQLNGKGADSMELTLKGPEYNIDQMEVKARPLVDEFLHNNDFEEAIRCVTELASPSTIHLFINAAINQVLERSSQARHSLGQLLFNLVKQNIITFDHYKKGFEVVLESIDEFALDIPMIWEYIGEILEPILEDNKFTLDVLKDVLKPCIWTVGISNPACAAKRRGTIKLGELWRESKLQWTDFLGDDAKIDEFILKHKLEFTICPTKVKPTTPMAIEEIKKNLLDLLEKTDESEEIFDWIDANVSECTEPKFIRALVSAVHENAIKDASSGCELDVTKLKKRISILTRYIDHNENLELQALYAIQSLMNQLNQPKGILRQIFDILYDDDVITEESFKNWEQSDDINEVEGKGVALHSVKSFFTWLKETDSGDSVTDE